MRAPPLNKLHRLVGIVIAPFVVVQALSGLFLDFGVFRRGVPLVGDETGARGWWELALMKTHFGPGLLNDAYHILLACGIVWMACSGWLLYLRIRRVRRQPGTPGGRP